MIECKFERGNKTKNLRHVVMDSIIEKEGKILLVKRSQLMDAEPGKLALPGGFLDKNETTQQGILREVLEETGYEAKIKEIFRVVDYPKRKGDLGKQNVSFVYLIEILKKIQEPDHETEEVIWADLNKIDEIKDQIAFDHFEYMIKPYIEYRKTGEKPEIVF